MPDRPSLAGLTSGRELLKLSSSRKASSWARLRAVESHCETNSWEFAAARSEGCNSAKVSSLKRKYPVTNFSSRMAAPGEKHHGGPLRLVVGDQQHFAFALEKSSGDVAGDIFGESDGAIVKRDMEGGALERHFADVVDPRFVQPHALQLRIQSFRGVCRRS